MNNNLSSPIASASADWSVEAIAATVKDGMARGEIYTSQAIFDLEMERIFHRAWVYVGHETEVPEPGDYRLRTIGTNPVIMVRGADQSVRVLMNRCRHRATAVCENPAGHTDYFRCWFHGWTYDTTGKLVHVQGAEAYDDNFRKEEMGLTPAARVDSYRGFVFASLSAEGPSLLDHLAGAARMIDVAVEASPKGELLVNYGVHRNKYRGNWKMVGMDGYHPEVLHASVWEILGRRSHKTFRDTYPDDDSVATRDFGNGHVMLDSHKQRLRGLQTRLDDFRKLPGGDQYIADMREAYGERADLLLAFGGDPHVGIFPNLQVIGNHIRVIVPIAPDLTEVHMYPTRLVGVSDEFNEHRLRLHEFFYGPAGTISPDDNEMFERVQVGLMAQADPWIDLTRGMGQEIRDEDGSVVGRISHELTQRSQLDAWKSLMIQA